MTVTTRQEEASASSASSARAGAQEGRGQRQAQQRQAPAQAQAQVQARAQARQRRSTRSTLSHSALADSTAKHVTLTNTATTATAAKNQHTMRVHQPHSARMKHPLDPINTNPDLPRAKRAKTSAFVIEIRSKPQPISPPKSAVVPAVRATTQQHNNAPPPLPPPATAAQPAKLAKTAQNQLTNHQKKVINGIRHELDRLQPGTADAPPPKDQGRKLRSQEATRFKSDLAHYFPDYDEVIGNEAKEHHILNIDTPILVVDSDGAPHHNVRTLPPRHATTATATNTPPSHSAQAVDGRGARLTHSHASDLDAYPVKSYGHRLFTDLYQAQRLSDLAGAQASHNDAQDPLPDSHYEQPHRKAERVEKTYRNTEKGRAQHEKDQIIRLLGELQGPDWLRTMGVSGVTESKKKTFEPARDHFVKGCQAILDKFRWWSQEEKRRKLERDRALAEEAASAEQELDEEEGEGEGEEEEDEGAEEGEEAGDGTVESEDEDEEMFDVESADNMADDQSDGDPPDSSDVDASIAKQLHEEARLARTKFALSDSSKRSRGELFTELSPEPEPAREFKSFFEKRYERDAALNKVRRSRRPVLAWGHPVPEIAEEDFELSVEFLDEETMQARERRKRRDRRGNRH